MPTVRESPMKSASSKYDASTVVNCSGVGSGVGVGSAVVSGVGVTAAVGSLPESLRAIYRDSSFVTLHQLPDFIESDE